MNILQVQDQLKGLSQDQLVREMQAPTGAAPQYLVLSEITRRQKMQNDLMAQQAKGPQTTVAQEAVAAAGVPQAGLPGIAQAMAPKTDVTNNTGAMPMPTPMPSESPVGMADGGYVQRFAGGGFPEKLDATIPGPPLVFMQDARVREYAANNRLRPGQLWKLLPAEQRAMWLSKADELIGGDFQRVNPSYDNVATENETRPGFIMPSQSELDTRYRLGQMPPSLGNLDANTTTLPGLPSLSAADISPLAPARIVLPSTSLDTAPGLLYGAPTELALSPYAMTTRADAIKRSGIEQYNDLDFDEKPWGDPKFENALTDSLLAEGWVSVIRGEDLLPPAPTGVVADPSDPYGMTTLLEEYKKKSAILDEYNDPNGRFANRTPKERRGAVADVSLASGVIPYGFTGEELLLPVPQEPDRTWGQRYIGDPLRSLFQPIGESAREIGQPIGEAAREIGQPIGAALSEAGQRMRTDPVYTPSRTDFGPTANELLAASAAAQGPSAASMQALAAQPEDPLSAFGGAGPELSSARSYPGWGADTSMAPYETLNNLLFPSAVSEGYDPAAPTDEELMSGIPADQIREDKQAALDAAESARTANEEAAATTEDKTLSDGAGAAGIGVVGGAGGTGGAGGSGAGGGAGAGAGKMSSFEQELMDAITRSEKRAEQDKWLALAQAGLEIMNAAGRQGTFAGAVGEGGAKGIAAFREGRDNAENTRLNLLKQLEDARMARATLAARSAGGGGGGSRGNYTVGQMMDDALGQLKTANDILSTPTGLDPSTALAAQNLRDNALRVLTGVQGQGKNNYQMPSAQQ